MRASRPQTPRQVRVTCTTANKFAVFIKIVWCRCSASAAIQLRKLGVRCTKSPARAVQSAQWRELDSSSSRATAESPAVMRCARRLSELRSSSVSGGTADGGKNMRAPRPHTPRQVRVTCTSAKQVCRLGKFHRRMTTTATLFQLFLKYPLDKSAGLDYNLIARAIFLIMHKEDKYAGHYE